MLARLMSLFLLGLIRALTGGQAIWQGCPPKAEQRIYFANRQSHADLLLMRAALPVELRSITRQIAAKDYWTKTPFKPAQAVAMALIACVAGSLGYLVMKALKI